MSFEDVSFRYPGTDRTVPDVVEPGPHAQLMRNRGLYAELYDLQASAYE